MHQAITARPESNTFQKTGRQKKVVIQLLKQEEFLLLQ